MDDKTIINLWKIGYSVDYISKKLQKDLKQKDNKFFTIYQCRCIVESIIFNYQKSLMKSDSLQF